MEHFTKKSLLQTIFNMALDLDIDLKDNLTGLEKTWVFLIKPNPPGFLGFIGFYRVLLVFFGFFILGIFSAIIFS